MRIGLSMNCNDFFGVLYKRLIENEFFLIDGLFDKPEIDDKSKYVGVYKITGNFVYCIALLNQTALGGDYEVYISDINYKIKTIMSKLDVGKVIFLSLVITDTPDNTICDFTEKFYYDDEEPFNSLCWVIDCNSKKIISGKNQPDKILNIHKIIYELFFEKADIVGDDFYYISESVEYEKNSRLKSHNTVVTFALLIINFIVFAVMELNGGSENTENLIRFGAISADLVFEKGDYFRLVTDMFVHIGFAHIAANSLSLYILGTRSEKYFGGPVFLIIYILSGVGASLASIMFTDNLSAGASGAIFGIMGAMLIYSAVSKKSMGDFSAYFMVIFSLISVCAGFFMSGVDNAGHIGGFIMGILMSIVYSLAEKKINKY